MKNLAVPVVVAYAGAQAVLAYARGQVVMGQEIDANRITLISAGAATAGWYLLRSTSKPIADGLAILALSQTVGYFHNRYWAPS